MIPDKCRPVHKSNCRGASSPFDFAPDSLVDCAQVRPREDSRPPLPQQGRLQRAAGLTLPSCLGRLRVWVRMSKWRGYEIGILLRKPDLLLPSSIAIDRGH